MERNRESVLAIYRSMRDRDLAAFTALVHPEIAVSQPAWLPYGGDHHGVEAMLQMFRRVLALVDVSALRLSSVVADGEHVWAEFIAHSRADGGEVHVAEHWRFDANGLACKLDVWIRDPATLGPVGF